MKVNNVLDEFLNAISVLQQELLSLPQEIGLEYHQKLWEILQTRLPPLHQTYDRYVTSELATRENSISCGKGCSHCCRHYVTSVEPFEILAIHFQIRQRKDYPDLLFSSHARTTRFEQLLNKEGGDVEAEDRALYRYYLRGIPCSFLEKDGTCGIYENRPMSCRMFFSESAPRFCEGNAVTSGWNKNFQIELPDIAEEALARCSEALANLNLPVGLFEGVLEANSLFGQYES